MIFNQIGGGATGTLKVEKGSVTGDGTNILKIPTDLTNIEMIHVYRDGIADTNSINCNNVMTPMSGRRRCSNFDNSAIVKAYGTRTYENNNDCSYLEESDNYKTNLSNGMLSLSFSNGSFNGNFKYYLVGA